MSNVDKLLSYITYFEKDNDYCKWITPEKGSFGFPQYSQKVKDFIDDVYQSELMVSDYHSQLRDFDEDYTLLLPEANYEQVKALLTYYVRGERFCDGMWESACKEKTFLKILYRLEELNKGPEPA